MKFIAYCLILSASIAFTVACTRFPLAYRQDIRQGNVIDQDSVEQLKLGMSKEQVGFLMGYPILDDPFKANYWDYVYLVHQRGKGNTIRRHIRLYFDGEELVKMTGELTVDQPDENNKDQQPAEKG